MKTFRVFKESIIDTTRITVAPGVFDEADTKNAILEIRAGTGGLEATLFDAELYKMYEKVCLKKKWLFQ